MTTALDRLRSIERECDKLVAVAGRARAFIETRIENDGSFKCHGRKIDDLACGECSACLLWIALVDAGYTPRNATSEGMP